MEDSKRGQLITWLKDAYGMEKMQLKMLDQFIDDFENDGEIRDRLEEHKRQTESQRDRVEQSLEKLDESPSKIKEMASSMMGTSQGMGTTFSGDTRVKDMLMIHAGEHFEHASYMGIKEAAEQLGETEIAEMADQIAAEEKAAADWSVEQLPKVVNEALAKSNA